MVGPGNRRFLRRRSRRSATDARAGGSRGAAAVEAGIVSILVFVLLFGIIEFGLLWRNIHVVTDAGREGAITASQLTRDPTYAQEAMNTIEARLDAISRGEAYHVTIFKADPGTGEPANGEDVLT